MNHKKALLLIIAQGGACRGIQCTQDNCPAQGICSIPRPSDSGQWLRDRCIEMYNEKYDKDNLKNDIVEMILQDGVII